MFNEMGHGPGEEYTQEINEDKKALEYLSSRGLNQEEIERLDTEVLNQYNLLMEDINDADKNKLGSVIDNWAMALRNGDPKKNEFAKKIADVLENR